MLRICNGTPDPIPIVIGRGARHDDCFVAYASTSVLNSEFRWN